MPYLSKILIAATELKQMTEENMGGEAAGEECFAALDIAQALHATIGAQAAQKKQLLRIDVSGLGSDALMGERTALMRVLTNLLTNAVKYTQEGGKISLTARLKRGEEDAAQAEFIVEDDGMGMTPEFMERMFEPFARAPQVIGGETEGCGLGLSIVRRLVKRLGGSIDVKSEWGKGTAFTVRVPLKIKKKASAALAGRRILLAEDSDLSAQIAQALLKKQGASVRRAADGEQAAELFLKEPDGTFDVILMDMRMPGMCGCAAAKMIRESGREDAKRIPILALTAGGDEQDLREAMAAGMDGCLRKPLNVGEVARAMDGERRNKGSVKNPSC